MYVIVEIENNSFRIHIYSNGWIICESRPVWYICGCGWRRTWLSTPCTLCRIGYKYLRHHFVTCVSRAQYWRQYYLASCILIALWVLFLTSSHQLMRVLSNLLEVTSNRRRLHIEYHCLIRKSQLFQPYPQSSNTATYHYFSPRIKRQILA